MGLWSLKSQCDSGARDMNLNIGDRVEDFVFHKGMMGTVIEVDYENPDNPIVEHGSITMRLDPEHIGVFPCSPPDEEHYVHYQWEKCLRKLP